MSGNGGPPLLQEGQWVVECTRQFFELALGPGSIPHDRGGPKVTLAIFDSEVRARMAVAAVFAALGDEAQNMALLDALGDEAGDAVETIFTVRSVAEIMADRVRRGIDPEKGVARER